jgi:hypothetical protein
MTDDQWREATDPLRMLSAVYPMRSEGSDAPQPRACRAYLLACARAQWEFLPEPARALVALGELANEGSRRAPLWGALELLAEELRESEEPPGRKWLARQLPPLARAALGRLAARGRFRFDSVRRGPLLEQHQWASLARLVWLPFQVRVPPFLWVPHYLHSADLLRETHGYPFAAVPVWFEDRWRTSGSVALARQMHETRQFGAMPILADALQEAGCEDARVLTHCRDDSAAHARGCWVLDRVLGFA